jgi:hypothetical protein
MHNECHTYVRHPTSQSLKLPEPTDPTRTRLPIRTRTSRHAARPFRKHIQYTTKTARGRQPDTRTHTNESSHPHTLVFLWPFNTFRPKRDRICVFLTSLAIFLLYSPLLQSHLGSVRSDASKRVRRGHFLLSRSLPRKDLITDYDRETQTHTTRAHYARLS